MESEKMSNRLRFTVDSLQFYVLNNRELLTVNGCQ